MHKYPAFLSYSRRDLEFARKLHSALESYRIPKNAGESQHSEQSDRVAPIFRDQDEVSASSNLGNTLTEALTQSSALIVIASPDAAASKWVNAEVDQFAKLGRANRIFVAIPPYISEERGFDVRSIFPPALLALGEPLAADFRKTCDGWTLAKLKIVAGVASIDLVRLRDRDAARRLRTMVVSTVAAVAVVGALGTMGWSALQSQERARQERVARSMEGVRSSLLSDQPGNALALLDSLGSDLRGEAAEGLQRVRLFWTASLQSPRDTLAALSPGQTVVVGNALYFRTANGVVPMAANGVDSVYQSKLSGDLFIQDATLALSRLNPATGEVTPLLQPPPDLVVSFPSLYELPDGSLIASFGGGGEGSVGGSYGVLMIAYPDGSNSGVIQNMTFSYFHTDTNCTRLYFADGHKGYGRPTSGEVNPNYVQELYAEPLAGSDRPSSLNVAPLTLGNEWRQGSVPGPVGLDFETFALDWLDTTGPTLDEACAAYALQAIELGSRQTLTVPSFNDAGLQRDNTLSPTRVWAQQAWLDRSLLTFDAELIDVSQPPRHFVQTTDGQHAVFQEMYSGAHTTHVVTLFCRQPARGPAQCVNTNSGTDDGRTTPLPRSRLVAMGGEFGFFDWTTMAAIPWVGGDEQRLVAESADGRTIMSLTNTGQIDVLSYQPGSPPTSVRTIADANFADATALAVIDDEDALIVLADGRLLRVNTASGATEWALRDRAVADAQNQSATVSVSDNRHYAAVSTGAGVRLYELSFGAPLTPFYRYADAGARGTLGDISVNVGDDGSLVVGSGGLAFTRAAPQARQLSGEAVCLYGAQVDDGRVTVVDIVGDSAMRSRCGLDSLAAN